MIAYSTAEMLNNNPARARHPPSLLCFPPFMSTMYTTIITRCNAAAKLARKPAERHMRQKAASSPSHWNSEG